MVSAPPELPGAQHRAEAGQSAAVAPAAATARVAAAAPATAATGCWGVLSLVGPDEVVIATFVLDGPGHPDLGVVDEVARLQLEAVRLGGRAVLETASPFLLELLELAGLSVEARRQPEGREDRARVQERVDGRDPAP
jgi:hypothetical protein